MPTTNYNVRFVESSDGVGVVALRNSTTSPVDATSGAPNRLPIPYLMDYGAVPVEGTVTAASNATPIVITLDTGEGASFTNGDLVYVEGVLGNTNANGTFFSTISSDSLTLTGSAGNAAWTSGGTIKKVKLASSYHISLAALAKAILNDKAAGN